MVDIKTELMNCEEIHIPITIVVDKSITMTGRIKELNDAFKEFEKFLQEDELLLGRPEVTIISFNSNVQIEVPFCLATEYRAPILAVDGDDGRSLNEAMSTVIDVIEERVQLYRLKDMSYYRPFIFVLTGGAATDDENEATAKVKIRDCIERRKREFIFTVIGDVDISSLQKYYPENEQQKTVLKKDSIKMVFDWLMNYLFFRTRVCENFLRE